LIKLLILVRGIFGVIFVVLWTAFMGVVTIATAVLFSRRTWVTAIIRTWARLMLWFFGVKTELEGEDQVPLGGRGFLYLFNHSSHFDIVAMAARLPGNFRFGAKAELFRIPIFGTAMRKAGVLEIHRGDRDRVLELYKSSVPRVEKGDSFALAPEGTRNEGEGIKAFKTGPFLFAVQAQMPIVPIVIEGARKVLPKGVLLPGLSAWHTRVKLRVLPPVPTQGLEPKDLDHLRTKVRELMLANYTEGQS
jgi:1-acyl-sn-glycerol-3-phosphate acyltransferase